MAVINFIVGTDPVDFSRYRNDPPMFSKIMKEGQGIDDVKVKKCIAEGKYIDALKAIWSEKNLPKRLAFLRQNAGEHAPILFELAIAEAEAVILKIQSYFPMRDNAAFKNVVNDVALPLIKYASLRVCEDCAAIKDRSLADAGGEMHFMYLQVINQLLEKKTGNDLSAFSDIKRMATAVLAKVEASSQENLPSPDWVTSHGSEAFYAKDFSTIFHSSADSQKFQKKVRKEFLIPFREALQKS